MAPFHAALAALSAIGFTACSEAVHDSVGLLQSTKKKTTCLICECKEGPVSEESRCIGTAFDKLMLRGRISSEKMLAAVAQEKTKACQNIMTAIGDDTVEQAVIDFEKYFATSFGQAKDKFAAVKKLYNQFAKAVKAELSNAEAPHVGTEFDHCLEQADNDMAHYEGLIEIGDNVFIMSKEPETKMSRLAEMITLSLNFIGRFRDNSYQCFKTLAYDITDLLDGPHEPFMMSIVRLGLHFDVVAMEAAEEEAIMLYTELECLGKKILIPVKPFSDPSLEEEMSEEDLDLPKGWDATTKTQQGKSLPEEDFPGLPESLKQLAHPKPKRRTKASLEALIADLPEMKKMLNPRQNKILDDAIALAKGESVPVSNETTAEAEEAN